MKSSSELYLSRLDHLRFFAALLVLFWHGVHQYIPTSYVPRNALFFLSLFEEGHTGVSLFMVLSGYIFMTLCRTREIVYVDFLRNRLLRIAPLFLTWLCLQLWIDPQIDAVRVLAALVTMTTPSGAMPGVGWTILVEFQFYLIFPLLLVVARRHGTRYLVGWIILLIVLRMLIFAMLGDVQNLAYLSLFGRLDQFILGMIAAEWAATRPDRFQSPWWLVLVFLGWAILFHLFNRVGGFYHLPERLKALWIVLPTIEGIAYALTTICWMQCRFALPSWLDDLLAWMGKLSFSFYLNHMLVIKAVKALLQRADLTPTGETGAVLVTLLVVFPCVIALSWLTFTLIEEPFLQMRRSYARVSSAPNSESLSEQRRAA